MLLLPCSLTCSTGAAFLFLLFPIQIHEMATAHRLLLLFISQSRFVIIHYVIGWLSGAVVGVVTRRSHSVNQPKEKKRFSLVKIKNKKSIHTEHNRTRQAGQTDKVKNGIHSTHVMDDRVVKHKIIERCNTQLVSSTASVRAMTDSISRCVLSE